MLDKVKIIECPRDAMQSIKTFIPTNIKLSYLQSVVDVGFDVVDIGSFVSPKAIPQLSDTSIIIDSIDLSNSNSELLVIVANKKGAINASKFEKISYLGYPFSISENFLFGDVRYNMIIISCGFISNFLDTSNITS